MLNRWSRPILTLFIVLVTLAPVEGQDTSTRPRTAPVAPPEGSTVTSGHQNEELLALQTKLRQILFTPEVRRGRVGIKAVSLRSGKVIFEYDSEKYFMPASNQKSFTVAAALELLGPDFRFVTSVFAPSMPDKDGVINGDLRVFGRGDVSISKTFHNGDETKAVDALVDRIAAAGVKRVQGSIVGDESYFKGFPIPSSWEWDDLQWYYGAEVSALPINDNVVELAVLPTAQGAPCRINITPLDSLYQIENTCTTGPASAKRTLAIHKHLDKNVLEISGVLPLGNEGHRGPIALSRPAELFVALLKQRLEARGIPVSGGSRLLPRGSTPNDTPVEIARLESPPLSLIAAKTMKPSQNMYTEVLLWTLGEEIGRRSGGSGDSSTLGLSVLKSFLRQAGIPDDGILPTDGSGLSRHNLMTPAANVRLYEYMAKESKNSAVWRNSLPIGGIDGTLANRFKGTAAANNVKGKTGTINQVSALTGYVTTAGGDELAVSVMVNGVAETRQRVSLIDSIFVEFANFKGKMEP
jgi:D-alanyl-D-alanine carboxypeptidase/D-alanyl-D-alanine-endopeptidase (penicillin-binding protein 4)